MNPMTDEQIKLVKKTWRMFRNIDPSVVGDTFYSKLFNDNPALRKMFPTNMETQYRKLMEMLTVIISRLDKIDEVSQDIRDMARRHVNYGVRPGHYRLVGQALMWTLEQGLGRDWTPEVKESWARCYGALSGMMMSATEHDGVK